MVANLYEALLQELGKVLGAEFSPDPNNSCLVKLPNGIEVQFELDKTGEQFLMGTNLGSVSPGRYRETLMREALRANGMPPPRFGVLAYSRQADTIVLFRWLKAKDINGEKVAFMLGPFSEKALEWRESIRRGEIPQFQNPTTTGHSGMFGMK